mgnify:CR=1 FL=1
MNKFNILIAMLVCLNIVAAPIFWKKTPKAS